MTHALPQNLADELRDLHEQMMRLTMRAGFLLERAGINILDTQPAPALPATVTNLDAYRASRGA